MPHLCSRDFIRPLLLLVLAFAVSACSRSGSEERRTLVLTGSSTVAPLASEIGKRFESLHPGVRIDVQTGGSSRGINDARQGLAGLGMVSRALGEKEKDLKAYTVARDGVALIVHGDNPINSLSDTEVVSIYQGKIGNWKTVGGMDAAITVVNKAEGRSTLELFLHYFKMKNSEVRPHVVIGDNEQGIKTVSTTKNAIAYVSIGAAEYAVTHGLPIKLLPIAGIPATLATVAEGTFPISRPLNFVSLSEPKGLAKEFIDFARSEAVHDIVRSQYFVPITEQ
ncbi:MAG: phosphate ABC transporter substrate-binding protein [Planctomycetota bacterium]